MINVIIGFIGLGMMGLRMAKRLLNQGVSLIVWNRSKEKINYLKDFKIKVADTPKDLAEKAEVILLMLSDENACDEVIFGANGIVKAEIRNKRELTIINFSTISPMYSTKVEEALKKSGIGYIESPVLGSIKAAEEGSLLAIVGGKRKLIESLSFIFDHLTKERVYVGTVKKAAALKLAINSLSLTIVSLFSEVLNFARSWEIEPDTIFNVLNKTWLKVIVEKYGKRVLSEDASPRFKVELAKKDLFYALRSGYKKDIPLHIISASVQAYTNAIKHRAPSKDYTRTIYEYYSSFVD